MFRLVLLLGVVLLASKAHAQVTATTPAAPSSAGKLAAQPTDPAMQQADNVFKWIKVHSAKPRKAETAAPAEANRKSAKSVAATPLASSSQPVTVIANVPEPPHAEPAPAVLIAPPPPAESVAQTKPPRALKALVQPQPEFPEDVMASLGTGSVKLRFTVQPDGTVTSPEVLATSHRRLNKAALDAIMNWRFEPVPVARAAQIELGFKLD